VAVATTAVAVAATAVAVAAAAVAVVATAVVAAKLYRKESLQRLLKWTYIC